MVNKYARMLEEQIENTRTGETWKLSDVPNLWRSKAEKKVIADGYYFDEDGLAWKSETTEE